MPGLSRAYRTDPAGGVKPHDEEALIEWAGDCFADPLFFVQTAFPWGEKGEPLHDQTGPDKWQEMVLNDIKAGIQKGMGAGESASAAIRIAVASGHGIGKSALVAWIVLWFMTTRPNPQVVVTANTDNQLKTKTWRELAKWHKLSIHQHWFSWTATQFKLNAEPETWFATAIPWSENNSEAFAGTHEKYVLMIFDEASAIAEIIWEVAEGALTTEGVVWLAFGNPTRNTGRFRQLWTKFSKRWVTHNVDSRTAKMANQTQIQEWLEDYGEDSDFFRVRVKGQFPKAGPTQLIPVDLVEEAQARTVNPDFIPLTTPRIMGVDVARFGDAQTVIARRYGPKLMPLTKFYGLDLMQTADQVARMWDAWKPDAVMIDAVGIGAGVYDRLVQLRYHPIAVNTGNRKHVREPKVYYNPRIEHWVAVKHWLATADLCEDRQLFEDLIAPEFMYDINMLMRLESKDDLRRRGIPSPDCADALALTFAEPVAPTGGMGGGLTGVGGSLEPEVP